MSQVPDTAAILVTMREVLADAARDGGDVIDPIAGDPALGFVNLTRLAEEASHALDHDEWLDDEVHPVWDLAIKAAEAFAEET